MRLVATSFVTLDGVLEGPGWDEHRDGRNAWALRIQDEETLDYYEELLFGADAILLGRTTYEIWAAFWPTATGELKYSKRLNEIPKYVVSRTLERAEWKNTRIIRKVPEGIVELKALQGGELLCYGSADLLASLMEHQLVDEYRLSVYPLVLGSGKHLFRDRIDTHHLRLVASRSFQGSGVVLLTYVPEAEAPDGRYVEEFSWTQEQIRSLQAAQDTTRVLATVLFTDIVDSTGRAASAGDQTWRQLLNRHDDIARSEVDRWHGRFVKQTGDGILATFDAPTRALRCAFDLRAALAQLGLEIRAAIHTGEIEVRDADVGGIGVHIAARTLAEASQSQVVVTRTVHDLATGTDLLFISLGLISLRGVPGQWELFEARIG
jgi:class 3 adenylate cyclase/dihydrofolate reductase